MNRRDRLVVRIIDVVILAATDRTRARIAVALLRAQRRLVPADLERRADWPSTWERYP